MCRGILGAVMARALRIEFPDALYHVTSRGNERRAIFRCDRDRNMFLRLLGMAAKRFRWSVTAWTLMTNHFHLVIQTPEPNLSRGMHWLNGSYAGWFNRSHKRSGHLFQGRFDAFLVEKESYFIELLRYVVLNPVRAGLVAQPDQYRWSSYRATAGLEQAPDWFDLAASRTPFGDAEAEGTMAYRSFVAAKVDSAECLWDKVTNAIYLGSDAWTRKMREQVESKPRSTDHPLTQRAIGRPKMAEVVGTIARVAKVSPDMIRSTAGGPVRRLAAWIGWHEGLLTLRSIAAALRLRSEGYVSKLIRQCERDFCANQPLLSQLDAALTLLRT